MPERELPPHEQIDYSPKFYNRKIFSEVNSILREGYEGWLYRRNEFMDTTESYLDLVKFPDEQALFVESLKHGQEFIHIFGFPRCTETELRYVADRFEVKMEGWREVRKLITTDNTEFDLDKIVLTKK